MDKLRALPLSTVLGWAAFLQGRAEAEKAAVEAAKKNAKRR